MYFKKKPYPTINKYSIVFLPPSFFDYRLMPGIFQFIFPKRCFCSFQDNSNRQQNVTLKFNKKESFYGYGRSEFLNNEGRGFIDRSLEEVVETSS